jgi:hypothetical protein
MCDIPLCYTDKKNSGGSHNHTLQFFNNVMQHIVAASNSIIYIKSLQSIFVIDCTHSSLYVLFC